MKYTKPGNPMVFRICMTVWVTKRLRQHATGQRSCTADETHTREIIRHAPELVITF